jgi:hypothetical protein
MCDVTGERYLRLVDDGPEEVMVLDAGVRIGLLGGYVSLGNPEDVIPERGPLIFLVPDVRTLKRGNLEVLFRHCPRLGSL